MLDDRKWSYLWTQLRATEFIAASETRVYATDVSGNLLILDRTNGEIIGRIPLRQFGNRVGNERTDRIFLADNSGLVLGLRELDSEWRWWRPPLRLPLRSDPCDQHLREDEQAPEGQRSGHHR